MSKVQSGEGELGLQTVEKFDPGLMVGVYICITPHVDWSIRVVLGKCLQNCREGCQSEDKMLLLAASWKVDTDMSTRSQTRNGEEQR